MEVSEIMTRHPEVIESSATIRTAFEKLSENDIRHLPVLRDGELVGMLSDRDIRGVAFLAGDARYEELLDKPTSNFMSSGVVSINAAADVADIIDIFIEGKFGAIPVVDGHSNKLVGIVSYIDVLKALRGRLE